MGDEMMRPIFCGNFEYDASERDVQRLFERYGPVERIDMKTGFAFVYMRDKRDGDEAVRDLDRREWGYRRPRPLKVEWAKKAEQPKTDQAPSKTLFIVNFDVMRTTIRDIEDHFDRYGRMRRVDIKRNFAFVEFDSLDDAIAAQKRTHGTSLRGRTITVEFVQGRGAGGDRDRDDGGGGGGGGGGYLRGRSRSRTPVRRRSPSYDRRGGRSRSRDRAGGSPLRGGARASPPRGRSPPRRERSRSADRMDRDGPRARSRSASPLPRD